MNRTRRAVGAAAIAVITSVFACTDLDPTAGSAKKLEINTGLLTIQVGQTLQANAAVRNALGTPVDGVDISWSSSNPLVATISSAGLVTAVAPGTSDVSASALGLSASALLTIVAASPTAAALTVTTQPSASVVSGSAFSTQPALQLRDSAGGAVAQPGVIVSVSIAPGEGTLAGTTIASTNASGLATFSSLSITGPVGTRTLNFSAPGFPAVASAGFNVTAGTAASLSIATQPSASAQSAVALAQQPVIQVRDASGNAVGQAGITVTAALLTGGGTLGGTAVVMTDASGAATFTDLSIIGAAGSRSLSFTTNALSAATSTPISITAGAATLSALAITTQPSASVQTGAALAQQPVVQIRDGNGNAVTQPGVTVTAAIATGGGTLGGTMAIATNASGVASFTDLSITGAAGSRTLSFTSGSLSSVTSNAIAISVPPPPPAALSMVTQPSTSAQSGFNLTRQPAIQLSDANGNAVSLAGISVTAAIATGGGTLAGNATVATNASGIATFTNLSVTGTVGARTLTFTSGSLTAATSSSIDITAGTSSALAITTQPSATALLGVAFAQQPAIQLRDGNGNAVSQAGTSVTVAIATGGGTLVGTATVATSASGVATFTNLSITGTAGIRTLAFTSGSLTAATSTSIDASLPPSLTITTQPSGTAQSGVAFAQQPAIQLRDGNGNALSQPGVSVTAAIGNGGGTLGGTTTAATDAAGLATFTDLKVSGLVGTRTLTFSAPTFAAATSANIGITPGPATVLSILTQPSASATTNVVFPAQPVLRLKDASTNDVSQSGVAVTVSLSSSGTLNGTKTATTNASGIVAFSGLSIADAGTFTLGFVATGLPGTPSVLSTVVTVAAPPPLATTLARPSITTTVNAAMIPVTPVTASGGTTPYTFDISPALPAGMSIGPTTGQVSGTPTATLASTTFTVTVTDAASAVSSKTFTLTVSSTPVANPLYFNSSEPGCGTDPSIVLCDDFESGSWYVKDCDQANASGGLLQTRGWCGTIYARPTTPAGAAVCSGAGAAGTDCAASGGLHTGAIGGVNMADHNLGPNADGYNEVWLRYYIKPSAGYQYGAQKMITFNSTPAGSGGISIGGAGSAFSDGGFDTCPVYDCNITGKVYYYRQNQGNKLTLSQITGHWAYVEMHVKLNTPGQANGVWELWVNDCGTDGKCTGTPTLRTRSTTVEWQAPTDNKLIRSIWFENWANPGSFGTELYDQVMVKTTGQIGFVPP